MPKNYYDMKFSLDKFDFISSINLNIHIQTSGK